MGESSPGGRGEKSLDKERDECAGRHYPKVSHGFEAYNTFSHPRIFELIFLHPVVANFTLNYL